MQGGVVSGTCRFGMLVGARQNRLCITQYLCGLAATSLSHIDGSLCVRHAATRLRLCLAGAGEPSFPLALLRGVLLRGVLLRVALVCDRLGCLVDRYIWSEADMSQFALEAPGANRLARVRLKSSGVQRL